MSSAAAATTPNASGASTQAMASAEAEQFLADPLAAVAASKPVRSASTISDEEAAELLRHAFAAATPAPAPKKEAGTTTSETAAATEDKSTQAKGSAAGASAKVQHIFLTSPPGLGKTTLVQKLVKKLKEEECQGEEYDPEIVGFYTEEVRDANGQRQGFDLVRLGGGPSYLPSRVGFARIGDDPPKIGKYSIDLGAFEANIIPAIETDPKFEFSNPRLCTFQDGRGEVKVDLLREELVPTVPLGPPGVSGQEPASEEPEKCAVIFVPSTRSEESVDLSQLRPVPSDWVAAEDELPPRMCVCDEVGKMALQSLKFPKTLENLLDSRATVVGTFPTPNRGQRDHAVIDSLKKRSDVRVFKMTQKNRDSLLDQAYIALRECLGLPPPGQKLQRAPSKRKLAELAKAKEEAVQKSTAEQEQLSKQEARAAKRKAREAKEKEEAKQREEQARKAREERKKRAEARQQQELARTKSQQSSLSELARTKSQASSMSAVSVDLEDDDDVQVEAISVSAAKRIRRTTSTESAPKSFVATPSPLPSPGANSNNADDDDVDIILDD